MSKLTKLIRHPHLYFKDAKVNREIKKLDAIEDKDVVIVNQTQEKQLTPNNVKHQVTKGTKVPEKKEAKMNTETILKTTVNTVWNNIAATNVNWKHIDVALYFSGEVKDIYQLEQWVSIFQELEKSKYFLIITRNKSAYNWVSENTDFSVVHCVTISDLLNIYDKNNIKCILYVNHAFKNFQSLINGQALHIHINHGESDKTSTITRQSQTYDHVFVYGQASIDKYNLNLIRNDEKKFIKVGRPQLEYTKKARRIQTDKKIVLYAPTWEGTHETMDFTSLNSLGLSTINQLIESDEFFIIYKPHPKVGVRIPKVKSIHKEIMMMLKKYEDSMIMLDGDIVSLYDQVDIAIFDNSTVLLDYLPYNKPLLFNYIEKNESQMMSRSILIDSGINLTQKNIYQLVDNINNELEADSHKESRNTVKSHYLGDFDYFNNESTTRFISEIDRLCLERNNELLELLELNKKNNS